MVSRQVSWLAGHCLRPCLPEAEWLQWRNMDEGSPPTVAGAAPALPVGAPNSLLALDHLIRETVTAIFSMLGAVAVNGWRSRGRNVISGTAT